MSKRHYKTASPEAVRYAYNYVKNRINRSNAPEKNDQQSQTAHRLPRPNPLPKVRRNEWQ